MKFNVISYTLFLYVIIMFCPSLSYAPWTIAYPPKPPQDVLKRNCAQWINYNGFTLDNYQINRQRAITRNVMKDMLASTWAALYAFKIGGIKDLYRILPQDFCNSFGSENLVPMRFKALKDESKDCVEWVKLYSFSENDLTYNYTYAMNTDPMKVTYISIWAYAYWLFVSRFGRTTPLTPLEHCSKMGKNVGDRSGPMIYMSEYATKLYCREWIYLFDYTDEPAHNLFKALSLNNASFNYDIHVHYFPCSYATQLLKSMVDGQPVDHLTPTEFCRKYDGDNINEPQKYNSNFREE